MKEFTLKTILNLLKLILLLIERIVKLLDIIRDFLDDKEVNNSTDYLSNDIDQMKDALTHWYNIIFGQTNEIEHDLE